MFRAEHLALAQSDPAWHQPAEKGWFGYFKYLILLFGLRALPGIQKAWILFLFMPL